MNADRWRQVDKIFQDALEREPQERASFLALACADDPSLKEEVDTLIRSFNKADSFLESPAKDPVAFSSSPAADGFAGQIFGIYEVKTLLGSGGMGEVYRARDTKLGRDVAIKVLPPEFTSDADRLDRFAREARVLATLNHPHIGAIYGLAEAGGKQGLVLELVEGETLAERIVRGGSSAPPIPIAEALTIARQIAEGLEAAHEKGIVHRDLKPANIKITPAGVVKVIDFGLAKAVAGGASAPDLSRSANATMGGTREGVILGTAAYMSPEQARGQAVDKRTDIWAFGCVLYEMSTGCPAFAGNTISDTIARILERDPDWTVLPASTPRAVRRLLQRCLDKDPKRRLHDIADARVEIEDALSEPASSLTSPAPVRKTRERLWIAATVVMIVALIANAAYNLNEPAEAPETRTQVLTPPGTDLTSLALSPDGLSVVFQAQGQLWLRPLAFEKARPLVGTEGGANPFWKPDSQSIGFFASGELKVIDVRSGIVQTLADTPNYGSGTWSEGGIILFAPSNTGPLFRIPEGGGEISEVTSVVPPHTNHRFPQFLPDGRHFLFFARGTPESQGVYLGSLDSPESRRLFAADSAAVFAPPAYAVFARQGVLQAQRLNLDTLEPVGEPSAVAGRVGQDRAFAGTVAVSASAAGMIAYQVEGRAKQLIWVNRSGQQAGTVGEPDASQPGGSGHVGLSPDGSVAISRTVNGNTDIWFNESGRGLEKFTSDLATEFHPVWSSHSDRIAFGSDRKGILDLYEAAISGNGAATPLVESSEPKTSMDWSQDGHFFLYTSQNQKTRNDLWVKPLFGDKEPYVVVNTTFRETGAKFSPDGRWITYESDESGRPEIYVQPFPGPGRRLSVSLNGGSGAVWRHDGRELFYVKPPDRLMVVSVTPGASTIKLGTPVELFAKEGEFVGSSPNGKQFLFNTFVEGAVPITILLNWKPPSE